MKLKIYQEKKLEMAKAIQRGATRKSLTSIARAHRTNSVIENDELLSEEDKKRLMTSSDSRPVTATVRTDHVQEKRKEETSSQSRKQEIEEEEAKDKYEEAQSMLLSSTSALDLLSSDRKSNRFLGKLVDTEDTTIYYR
jgi:phosphoribosylformylglycinamidine (FGAM) synthase-like enzyme